MAETIAENEVQIPTKSKSLRAKSILKRLETERNKRCARGNRARASTNLKIKPSRKEQNGYTMSKYRRRAANAKERDRMKLVNEAFDRLRDAVPGVQDQPRPQIPLIPTKSEVSPGAKSTKVTTLRCAIQYIKSLQQLIEDINNGTVDPEMYKAFNSVQDQVIKSNTNDKKRRKNNNKKNKGIKKQKSSKSKFGGNNFSRNKKSDFSGLGGIIVENSMGLNEKPLQISSVLSSLQNLHRQQLQRPLEEGSVKLKQIFTADFLTTKKKSTKNDAATSYIVVVTGNAGTIYQPVHPVCQISSSQSFLPATVANTTLSKHQLTLSGTAVPLPLQPVSTFSSNSEFDQFCSNVEDCESTLDDIEQVLKDAENFDFLS